VYRTVTVIGLGTLGGFLCKHLSEVENVKELIVVDYDIVESRNVYRSVYKPTDVGDYKVNALANLLDDYVAVTKIKTRYIEGETKLPKSDLVIDCRDVVCDRQNEIDVRFYISHKTLIIDCRKKVENICSYQGGYITQLNKSEISKAAFFATQTILSGHLNKLMKNNMIQKIDLNLISSVMDKNIQSSLENKIDIIYEMADNSKRLQCIEENINPILNLNKKQNVDVFVGGKSNYEILTRRQFPEVAKTKYHLVPQNSLLTSGDVIGKLTSIVKQQPGITNFIIAVVHENGKSYVELLEETGAA